MFGDETPNFAQKKNYTKYAVKRIETNFSIHKNQIKNFKIHIYDTLRENHDILTLQHLFVKSLPNKV